MTFGRPARHQISNFKSVFLVLKDDGQTNHIYVQARSVLPNSETTPDRRANGNWFTQDVWMLRKIYTTWPIEQGSIVDFAAKNLV